ncbi:MAG: hypothetical protein CSA81_13915 [Acidobacteria bacterium]|nr:MAG: hypothetical protein CSA81_13915 [Acidobacteriota bacterium]
MFGLKRSGFVVAGVFAICVLLAAVAYQQYQIMQIKSADTSGQDTSQTKSEDVVSQVSKIILLPEDEVPMVVQLNKESVADENKDDFIKDAKEGDYVLIYPAREWSVIYRPSENRLVNADQVTVQKN